MSNEIKSKMRNVMSLAWQFVKRNGYSMSEALKCAWANFKLIAAMAKGIVKFYYTKVDGSRREAFGTLKASLLPSVAGERRHNDTLQVYYDTERQGWRSFKRANLKF